MNTWKSENKLSNLILSESSVGVFGALLMALMLLLAFIAASPADGQPHQKTAQTSASQVSDSKDVATVRR